MPWMIPLWGVMFGAVFGSFINCLRVRIPAKQSLRHPPSQCDACHRTLTFLDLVPIVSYVMLRGRCRSCGTYIGPLTLLVELVCAALGGALFFCITLAF